MKNCDVCVGGSWAVTAAALMVLGGTALAQEKLHFTYLWHMEQPIYWPQRQAGASFNSVNDRYERAWETIVRKDANPGAAPGDNLREIFSVPDRVAAYQFRPFDSISDMASSGASEAGAQVSFSGNLIENLQSLGNANQLGYSPTWFQPYRNGRNWLTSASSNNKPRLDVVQFSFHHALLPLVDDAVVRKELQTYRAIYPDAWGPGGAGGTPAQSRGFFPSEMSFSTRLIPILASEGVAWSIVSSEKISRAYADFPVVYGSGGINCDPPNPADQVNGNAGFFYRQSISRGCSPAEAAPWGLLPRRAAYVDPNTGVTSSIIVVPSSQSVSWKDGSQPLGLSDFNNLEPRNTIPGRPMLLMLAHDGDNFFGGGFSYYREATPNLVSQARAAGYVPTVVEKYLADHPVPANDIVHVEPGPWVNADGCFGSPQFLNWNWPPITATGQIDVANGWHVDLRNWGVITAATNVVEMAEQVHRDRGGSVDARRIVYPTISGTNQAERAWHYLLGSLNSGFMYYGTALDMENKPAVACNRAIEHANSLMNAGPRTDRTAPTIWEPQRYPWNPGAVNFGPQYGYQQRNLGTSFQVYTFVHDVSGLSRVVLRYRTDNDGVRGVISPDNDTYAGGPGVSAWTDIAMTARNFPAGNVYNDSSITFTTTPLAMATYYHATVSGLSNKLVDYYIEAEDAAGNIKRSPIQRVWVDDGQGSGGGNPSGPAVTISPAQPVAGQSVTITYNSSGRPLAGASSVNLYYGINTWQGVQTVAMTAGSGANAGTFSRTISVPSNATSLEFVFNNGAGTWDNNGGADWRYTVSGGQPVPTWTIDGTRDSDASLLGSVSSGGQSASVWSGVKGDVLYVATEPPSNGRDRFILVAGAPGALRPAMWAKGGQVATWDAFIGMESSNGFAGWFDQAAGGTALNRSVSVVEGTVNLRTELGLSAGANLPEQVYVALGVYENPDGGTLVAGLQPTPAGSNGNGVIEGAEWFAVRTSAVPACGADIGSEGGSEVGDGLLDNNDFVVFINWFFAGDARADMGSEGGAMGRDGVFDNNDFIVFIDGFFAGC
jgi:hypothetical protein